MSKRDGHLKKIYITSGVGGSGKDTFYEFVSKYISAYKYSIITQPKEAAKIFGWDGSKTEKDRKFLSDIMDLATNYNDSPYEDVVAIVNDFKKNLIDADVLFIDMRDPYDIARAVKMFQAETILITNPNSKDIKSNHADANVSQYNYDYVITNGGSLKDLDSIALAFVKHVIERSQNERFGIVRGGAYLLGKEGLL